MPLFSPSPAGPFPPSTALLSSAGMPAPCSQHTLLPSCSSRDSHDLGHLRLTPATGGFSAAAAGHASVQPPEGRAQGRGVGKARLTKLCSPCSFWLLLAADFKGGAGCFAISGQSWGPSFVPMTQCFQQPRAFCQTHLLALPGCCYYLLFNPIIILANSKASQDAACCEDSTKLSTTSS